MDLRKEFLSHPHSKRNERKTEREEPKEIQTTFLFLLSYPLPSYLLLFSPLYRLLSYHPSSSNDLSYVTCL